MNIWILTVGGSDVQLKTNANWQKLFASGRSQLEPDRGFRPLEDPDNHRFQIPARVMGIIYSQPQAEQHFDELVFPLIDSFLGKIKDKSIHKIILVLSDQSIFSIKDRSSQRHAYWQDTCTLRPIVEKYLKKQLEDSSSSLTFQPLTLRSTSTSEGLDNWNSVLRLVQDEFSSIEADDGTIYVSHQAGTPAISSAVQFSSLARFGDRVKFLVSNEHNPKLTDFVESSRYLQGIHIEQAKKLLDRHDYSGVQQLIGTHLKNEAQFLLNAAIQWNFAKFQEFVQELEKHPNFRVIVQERTKEENWWWTAYEAAYLALIRLGKQGDKDAAKDTVDALFHSFRAIEGMFTEWGIYQFKDHIHIRDDRPYLQATILEKEQYFSRVKYKNQDGEQVPDNDIAKLKKSLEDSRDQQKDIVFYGLTIYTLFREVKQDWKTKCKTINRFWDTNNGITEKRNKVFHQLRGITEDELFKIWEVGCFDAWKERIRDFANFVSGQSFEFLDKESSSGEVASLMVKVHRELEEEIAQLHLSSTLSI
jgi:hypothetical protein